MKSYWFGDFNVTMQGNILPEVLKDSVCLDKLVGVLTPTWILLCDRRGKIYFANQWAYQEFQKKGDPFPDNLSNLLSGDQFAEFLKILPEEPSTLKNFSFTLSGSDNRERKCKARHVDGLIVFCGEEEEVNPETFDAIRGNLLEQIGDVNGVLDLIEKSPSYILIRFKIDGTILYVSEGFSKILGWEQHEAVGKSGYTFIHKDDIQEVEHAHAALMTGAPATVTFRRIHKYSYPIYVQANVSAHAWDQSTGIEELIDVECVATEHNVSTFESAWTSMVSDLVLQLQEPNNQIISAMNIVTTTMEDLKGSNTPDTADSQLLHYMERREKILKEMDEMLTLLEQESTYLQTILADLVTFKDIKQGRPILRGELFKAFSPNGEMMKLVNIFGNFLRDDKIDLTYQIVKFNELVEGYPSLIFGKIFHNLVANAKTALLKTSRKRRIHLSMSIKQNTEVSVTFVFAVHDNGPGIPPHLQQKIFDAYLQHKNRDSVSGMGLGLYIVKNIIEAMNGKIWVDSKPDKHTKFSFQLTFPKVTKLTPVSEFEYEDSTKERAIPLSPDHPPSSKPTDQDVAKSEPPKTAPSNKSDLQEDFPESPSIRQGTQEATAGDAPINKEASQQVPEAPSSAEQPIQIASAKIPPPEERTLEEAKSIYRPDQEPDEISEKQPRSNIKSTRILFADDHPGQRKLISYLCKSNGIDVELAVDGVNALQCYSGSNAPFDAYILDYEMPGMVGPEVTRNLRQDGVKDLIIGFTGKSNIDVEDTFIGAGADLVFSKPFSMKSILTEVMNRVKR